MWGDNDLGGNFSLLEGDRMEDRVIVFCSGRSASVCNGGTYILPIYSRHMDSAGQYAEYVETAKSNDDYIIAQTLQIADKRRNYWIIDKDFSINKFDKEKCDSIIQSHVFGPFDEGEFKRRKDELKLDLNFE